MLDKHHKKESPTFTGITRGVGGFGFGSSSGGGGFDGLYNFSHVTFSSQKIDAVGPSLAEIRTYMTGDGYESTWNTDTNFLDVYNGQVVWTVPKSGTYKFIVKGAGNWVGGYEGGYGHRVTVNEPGLIEGEKIRILVGQRSPSQGGGAGGTFVTRSISSTYLIVDSIIAVAGGSGGGTGYKSGFNPYNNMVNGGGNGADAIDNLGNPGVPGYVAGGGYGSGGGSNYGSGGGGFVNQVYYNSAWRSGNGENATSSGGSYSWTYGGYSYYNGGYGGGHNQQYSYPTRKGGFGGGGAPGWFHGAGGGGYSGGGGAGNGSPYNGGGGGSKYGIRTTNRSQGLGSADYGSCYIEFVSNP